MMPCFKYMDELQRTGSVYAQAFVFLLYTGLRVGELASMTMEGDWVRAVSLKGRKGLKDKIRRIPVSPNLKRFLPFIQTEQIVALSKDSISRHMSDYFEGHHTHDLRHTFITRAGSCDPPRDRFLVGRACVRFERYDHRLYAFGAERTDPDGRDKKV
mgnify:CR=1 FL=1